MANHIRIHNPSGLSDPTPFVYSHTASVEPGSRYIHVAGQVGFNKDGTIPADFTAQARLAFANLKICLAESGATIRDIVSLTTYIVDGEGTTRLIWDLFRELLTDEKGLFAPPAAVVPVPALAAPGLKIEIQCVAATKPRSASVADGILRPIQPITEVDVIVVGAGLSGMQAATDVQNAGLSCIVLEAKDRVGGKTFTTKVQNGPGVLDLGGAWINDQTQPRMYALFKKFGFEPIVQRVQGDEVFRSNKSSQIHRTAWPGLPPVEARQREVWTKIADELDEDCKSIDLHDSTANTHIEDISLGEYFRRKGADEGGYAFNFWRAWIRALTGTEPDQIGLVYMLDYIKSAGGVQSLLSDGPDGAQYMTNRRGNQTISKRLAADLKANSVRLSTPVNRITQTSDGALVETMTREIFRCRKVLIAIPTPLYRHIKFSPQLPADKLEYVNSVHLGPYCKCILIYAAPWWREAGLNGSFIDLDGPVTFSRDVSSDQDGMYVISCLIFGDYALKWMRLPISRRVQAVKDQLADMLPEEYRGKVNDTIETIEKNWFTELWSEGVPCPMPAPGGIWPRLGNALRRPFGHLHFIGTETAIEWKGYMEGAVRAGERGAAEVIAAMGSEDRPKAGPKL